ncbi:shikimate dehydrogenase [Acidobacteria bacterium AB60]|nr:shikimate dehydrogenase [Acidobacteria bacterium AB60]
MNKSASPSTPARPKTRLGRICIAIQAGTPGQMLERAEAALKNASFLEFRLDSLPRPAAALPRFKTFFSEHPKVTVIGTCRRKANGGQFNGSLSEELDILLKAGRAGCRIIDLEVESAEEASPAQLDKFKAALRASGAELLISFHDFARTGALDQAADHIAGFEPDFIKVVPTALTLADNLAVLRLLANRSIHSRIVAMAMGEEGIVSRVLGPLSGSAFTFASSQEGAETAPGQVTGQTLRTLYRADKLNSETLVFGVAGNPIAHSLSPLLHNSAFRREHINAVLLPLKVRTLADFLNLALELPLSGAAITMPLKREILPHLDQIDPLTRQIGACNTLRITVDRKIFGFNTDVEGVVRPLEKRIPLRGAKIAVIGAGGAARAAVFGLVQKGAEVLVVNRTHESALALAKAAGAAAVKHEYLARNRVDILINSTPCGMAGSAQSHPIAENELNAGIIFDMVYNPLETPLLRLAKSRGIPVISGMEMFVQQGARQFEIWTGKTPPEQAMQRIVEQELRRNAR